MAELKIALRLDSLGLPLRKSFECAARMGVRYVQLDARNDVRAADLTDTGIRQLKKMLDDANLTVVALRFQTRRGYDNQNDLEQRIDATKATMRLAYRLGAPVVVNNIGRVPDSDEDPIWHSFQSVVHDLGSYGARVGAFLAAETGSESGERLAALLGDELDAFVAVALNPGQLIINRHSVGEAIKALKDRIQLVCAVDGVLDLSAGRGISVPLGQGSADFPELIGMLEDVEYRGQYVVGRPDSSLAELAQGVEYLQNL